MFTLPDIYGRIVVMGICKNPISVTNRFVKVTYTSTSGYNGYSIEIDGFTRSLGTSTRILSANYYDNYDFRGVVATGIPSVGTEYNAEIGYGTQYTGGAKGLLTGTLTAQLNAGGTPSSDYLYSVMYYDIRGRLIQTKSNNPLVDGIDQEYLAYDFVGNVTQRKHVHQAAGKTPQSEIYQYDYDHVGRLLTTTHKLNTETEVILVNNTYDELGRLKTNKHNGNSNLKTDYEYNVRSWTKSITNPLFSQNLYYTSGIGKACYNGNVSSMNWKTHADSDIRGYRFEYDALSRLKNAVYGEGKGLYLNTNRFSEQITDYDKNGNILGLKRYGQVSANDYGLIDNLIFTLTGNQLKNVNDSVSVSAFGDGFDFKDGSMENVEYSYDGNGNLTKDLNKKIVDIQYNYLNLPCCIEFADGNSINNSYGANGTKLSTTHIIGNDTTVTSYCGNLIYENGVAKTLLVEGGYVSLSDNRYHFYIQDHQGNNRIVADENGMPEEVNHYYPFGGTFASSSSIQPYKYNGKELNTKNGLNWYDYGARMYDAALGRFMKIDRYAEKYVSLSPYQYVANNPVNNLDINGDSIWFTSQYNDDRRLIGITMHVTGKVLNDSNERIDMKTVTNNISKAIGRAYKGQIDDISFNTDVQLSSAKNMDEVSNSDHLFVLTDKITELKDGEIYGASNYPGGKVAFINAEYFSGIYDENLGSRNYGSFTAAHEFGHLAGLGHSHNPFNIMRSNGMFYGINASQLGTIYNKWGRGNLNLGTNYILNPVGHKRPNTGSAGIYVKPW